MLLQHLHSEDTTTFFPSNWSKEKTTQVIFDAAQNRIKFIDRQNGREKYLCKGEGNV